MLPLGLSGKPAASRLEAVDVAFASTLKVGYVPGVGDNVAPMLQQLGLIPAPGTAPA